jgi:hypothetical protein
LSQILADDIHVLVMQTPAPQVDMAFHFFAFHEVSRR